MKKRKINDSETVQKVRENEGSMGKERSPSFLESGGSPLLRVLNSSTINISYEAYLYVNSTPSI